MPPDETKDSGSTRSAPRVLLILAGALLVLRVATGVWEYQHPPTALERVSWQPIVAGEAAARAGGRPILYDFTAEWCPPCRRLNREVFADAKSGDWINGAFVPVRVMDRAREEGHNSPEVDSLQQRFHVKAFPTLVVVSAHGGDPAVIEGYAGKREVVRELSTAYVKLTGAMAPRGMRFQIGRIGPDSGGAGAR